MGNLNHENWARSMISFIRTRNLESEFKDYCGGWPCRVASLDDDPWQLIETAPTMREIILWADTSTPDFPNWKMASGYFHTGMNVWIWGGEQVRDWAFPPTHWMPLPDAPAIAIETRSAETARLSPKGESAGAQPIAMKSQDKSS